MDRDPDPFGRRLTWRNLIGQLENPLLFQSVNE